MKSVTISTFWSGDIVAPLAGAWIEIQAGSVAGGRKQVAPLAGAWIEMDGLIAIFDVGSRRSPRGSVD